MLARVQPQAVRVPMISKSELMAKVLDACPSFNDEWQELVLDWEDEGEPPIYISLARFARHLVSLLEAADKTALRSAFSIIEELQVTGAEEVKEAATIGILENLQNTNIHNTTTPVEFEKYLGKESRTLWDRLNQFWDNR